MSDERDAERLERYVHSAFLRSGRTAWPDIRMACKALGWTMVRIEAAIEDSELLDTQEYYCAPPEPRRDHEIYSTKDELYV